jgi:hypothetical protein
MHMTCKHCRYEYCWMCFLPWKDHKSCDHPTIIKVIKFIHKYFQRKMNYIKNNLKKTMKHFNSTLKSLSNT